MIIQVQVFWKTAGLFLTLKAIITDLLLKSTMNIKLFGLGLLEHMQNMTKLMQTKFKDMNIRPIKTEEDYENALERLEYIFDAKRDTKEGDELEILSILIEKYEDEKYPIGLPDPIEAIKFRMEQLGLNQTDLIKIFGYKSRVSEILNKKRKLTLDMIRNLNGKLSIPTNILIQQY